MSVSPLSGAILYHGSVLHRRLRPKRHRLSYKVFSLAVDLESLDRLDREFRLFAHNRWGLFSFHDRDHGASDGTPLRAHVEGVLGRAGINLAGGSITLLCYPRILGFAFNPLSTYYCRDSQGALRAILYEVRNTFGQCHSYLIPVEDPDAPLVRQTCPKVFYVSPFMEMEGAYHFRMLPPGERVALSIQQTDGEGRTLLHASFVGEGEGMTDRALLRAFLRYPLMTVKVVVGIHWEALQLWMKGMRLVPRPAPPGESVSLHPPKNDTVGDPKTGSVRR
ncbi:DUF1365 domain-containing protein [Rhodospirillum sp. A1_3_36]|uniref:DUF1365 domain-containing protein n=1 Tax=Rhodospirillum sp. A1_3_36 TaxID=3391666 RepID=UPI0039A552F8